ncbi:MAG TPA: bifunctional phosphoglucose/phosphomannose isomerase [Ignavibacteria bacterium]|nr:bifunctional phosphoglucose/phosphomannose isomerase [Ignavibacteria bacterium]
MITQSAIKLVDRSNMFDVLMSFDKQVKEAVEIGSSIQLPREYDNINKIIISGLGGSAIGGDLLRSYLNKEIKIPVSVNRNYFLPGFADENTLVIISSYSGNTEESLSAYDDAKSKKCRIVCISSGGNLSILASGDGFPVIKVPGGFQPRCALGYSFIPMLFLFQSLGFISDRTIEINNLIDMISIKGNLYGNIDESENPALKIAIHLQGKIPVIYSSNNLLDIVNLRWRCQMNENAKMLAFGNYLPEMNHNEIVGWEVNPDLLKNLGVIFLNDPGDFERIKRRQEVTKELLKPFAGLIFEISSDCSKKLERIMDLVYLGDWVSFYLAILNKVDPTPIEKINILKSKLTEL